MSRTAAPAETTPPTPPPSAPAPTGAWSRFDATGLPLLVARLVVGITFVVMGLAKVEDPIGFLKLVREFELAPNLPWLLNGIAGLVPWLEIWCGGLLVLGVGVRGAAGTLSILLVVFTIAIQDRGATLAAHDGVSFCAIAFDCGCGGGIVNVCRKIGENLGLLVLALTAVVSRSRRFCLRHALLGR